MHMRAVVESLQAPHAAAVLAARLSGAAPVHLFALERGSGRLVLTATTGPHEDLVGRYAFAADHGLSGWALLNRTPALLRSEPEQDPRYFPSSELGCAEHQSILVVPLFGTDGGPSGVLFLAAVE